MKSPPSVPSNSLHLSAEGASASVHLDPLHIKTNLCKKQKDLDTIQRKWFAPVQLGI